MFQQAYRISGALLAIFLFVETGSAQVAGGKFQKLFDLYVMGDYEKCGMKAEKMTEKDKYKRESEPYLYLSMSFLKIADDPELNQLEVYDNATKDAIKYGTKFVKKDLKRKEKDLDYLYDDNYQYVQELKQVAIEEAKAELAQNDYRKAVYYYKLALQLDENDPAVRLMKGTADYLSKNRREGSENVDMALEQFRAIAKEGKYEPAEEIELAFEDGFIYYADYLVDNNQLAEAQEILELARTLAPENKNFSRKLKQITG